MLTLRLLLILLVGVVGVCRAEEMPALDMPDQIPPFLDPTSNSSNSLMDLLKTDLLKRYQSSADPSGKNNRLSRQRPDRPSPELGDRSPQPLDLSKYIGPDSDIRKTMDHLAEKGAYPSGIAPPTTPSASPDLSDRWKGIPREKRFAFANDLFNRRKYESALNEYESMLNEKLKGQELIDALTMREKCLFHKKFYSTVEEDCYRLKSYYPKEKAIDELKKYLEEKSGIAALQEAVMQDPTSPTAQRHLLDAYKHYQWLDFAETFLLRTIQDTSPETIASLSEVYFLKKDYAMLVSLSRKAQELYPKDAEFYYNEGVGLYRSDDPEAKQKAKACFQKASQYGPNPRLLTNINWYLQRFSSGKP